MIKILLVIFMISSSISKDLNTNFYSIMDMVSASTQRQGTDCTDKLCLVTHNYSGTYEFKSINVNEKNITGDLLLNFNVYYVAKTQFFDDYSSYDYTVTIPNFTFSNHSAGRFNTPVFSFRNQKEIERYNLIRRLGAHGIGVENLFTQIEKDYKNLASQLEKSFEDNRKKAEFADKAEQAEILAKFSN